MADIESRSDLIDEVQLKTNLLGNVLRDVQVNLEVLTEQQAIVDHVVQQMARVQENARSAEVTLKTLQAERQLAERIAHGIKRLRPSSLVVAEEDDAKRSA